MTELAITTDVGTYLRQNGEFGDHDPWWSITHGQFTWIEVSVNGFYYKGTHTDMAADPVTRFMVSELASGNLQRTGAIMADTSIALENVSLEFPDIASTIRVFSADTLVKPGFSCANIQRWPLAGLNDSQHSAYINDKWSVKTKSKVVGNLLYWYEYEGTDVCDQTFLAKAGSAMLSRMGASGLTVVFGPISEIRAMANLGTVDGVIGVVADNNALNSEVATLNGSLTETQRTAELELAQMEAQIAQMKTDAAAVALERMQLDAARTLEEQQAAYASELASQQMTTVEPVDNTAVYNTLLDSIPDVTEELPALPTAATDESMQEADTPWYRNLVIIGPIIGGVIFLFIILLMAFRKPAVPVPASS